MAAVDIDAVEARVRAVLEGAGSVRTVTSGRLKPAKTGDLGAAAQKLGLSATVDRYQIRVRILGDNPATPTRPCNLHLTDIEVEVRIFTSLDHPQRRIAARMSRHSRAQETANLVKQALEWPGNMTGVGLSSDVLLQQPGPPVNELPEAKVLEQRLVFHGVAVETLAVS